MYNRLKILHALMRDTTIKTEISKLVDECCNLLKINKPANPPVAIKNVYYGNGDEATLILGEVVLLL
jgi:hypothetical protein